MMKLHSLLLGAAMVVVLAGTATAKCTSSSKNCSKGSSACSSGSASCTCNCTKGAPCAYGVPCACSCSVNGSCLKGACGSGTQSQPKVTTKAPAKKTPYKKPLKPSLRRK